MSFRITGLASGPFRHLYGLADDDLAVLGVKRYVADRKPGFPDRIEVRDAEPGESLLLVNHFHQPADTPYRASHAIFVREGATETYDGVGTVPEVMWIRTISLRAFDEADLMVDADLVDGRDLERLIARFFANGAVSYMHAHYAKRGCYAARVDRTSVHRFGAPRARSQMGRARPAGAPPQTPRSSARIQGDPREDFRSAVPG